MEQPEPKHSQKKSNVSRAEILGRPKKLNFGGLFSKVCLKIQARRPRRGIMDSGSTVMLGLLFCFLLGGNTSKRLDTLVLLRYVSFLPFSLVSFDISVTELQTGAPIPLMLAAKVVLVGERKLISAFELLSYFATLNIEKDPSCSKLMIGWPC